MSKWIHFIKPIQNPNDADIYVISMCTAPHTVSLLGLRTANERGRYKVTPSLIAWAQTYNQTSISNTSCI